jgi:uncharacterized protein
VVSTDIVEWYSPDSKIRRDYNEIRTSMSGISPVSLFIESKDGRSVIEADVIRAIHSLSEELEARVGVGKVLAISHPLMMMRGAYGNGDFSLPTSRSEANQYLLLLESEEPVWDLISRDQKSARMAMRVNDNGSEAIVGIASWAKDWWKTNGPGDFSAQPTGLMYEFAKTNKAIVRTQVSGLLLAFAGVGVVLLVVLGSFRLAAAALLPNLIPLAAAYGAMGYLGIPLDAGTACLGSLALGIAVDDTVHVATHWSRRRAIGMEHDKAILGSLSAVMPALVLSSACIVAGFGVLGTSDLGLVRNL